jgi:uncharacterized protein YjbI with pentapeptide repeats
MATIFINSPRIATELTDPESLKKLDTIHVSLQNQGQGTDKLSYQSRIIRLQKVRRNNFEVAAKKQEELDVIFQQIQMENELHKGLKNTYQNHNLSNCLTVSPVLRNADFQHAYSGYNDGTLTQRKQLMKKLASKAAEEHMIEEIMIKN